jgi:hypothetical protein
LDVTAEQFEAAASFIVNVAKKTAAGAQRSIRDYISSNQIKLTEATKKAIDFLTME